MWLGFNFLNNEIKQVQNCDEITIKISRLWWDHINKINCYKDHSNNFF